MATAKAKHAVFEQWFKARCVQDGNASTLQRALYADYAHFAKAGAMGDQAFARAMEREGFRLLKREEGAHRRGIRLKVAFMGAADAVDEIEVELALPPGALTYKETAPGEPYASPLVWDLRSAPYKGGPSTFSIAMDCPDSKDVTPAKIAAELYVEARRVRQPIDAGGEDLTVADDDALPAGELARMGAAYAFAGSIPAKWKSWLTLSGKPPRDHEGAPVIGILRMLWLRGAELWKPAGQRRMLVKAGALIVHAIARIDREEALKQGGKS